LGQCETRIVCTHKVKQISWINQLLPNKQFSNHQTLMAEKYSIHSVPHAEKIWLPHEQQFLADDWKFGFVVLATLVGHQWHGGNDKLHSKVF
jgi:hypothetical protein